MKECTAEQPFVFLAMELYIEGDVDERLLIVSQSAYIQSVLERFGNPSPRRQSIDEKRFTVEYLCADIPENPLLGARQQTEFRSLLGSESFAVLHTRRDLMAAVAIAAEGQAAPRSQHQQVVEEVLQFTAATPQRRLELPVPPLRGPMKLAGHADANLLSERARQGLAFAVGDDTVMTVTH